MGCNNSNGDVAVIDLRNANPANSEFSNTDGFWDLIGDISRSLLKLKYLQCLDSSLNALIELDHVELLHQVLKLLLACNVMLSLVNF